MKYLQSIFRVPSNSLVTVALLSLLLALPVYAQMNVVVGTGQIGDGVTLSVVTNGQGNTSGGKVHSPSGAPDLWFRAGSTPTFPGALSTYAEWGFESHGSPLPWEGAVTGTDNWMKTIRDSDGCVSWSQFEFDFTAATREGFSKMVTKQRLKLTMKQKELR